MSDWSPKDLSDFDDPLPAALLPAQIPAAKVSGDIAGNAAGLTAPIAQSLVTGLSGSLAAKAADSAVVHLAGAESIAGAKEFGGALARSVTDTTVGISVTKQVGSSSQSALDLADLSGLGKSFRILSDGAALGAPGVLIPRFYMDTVGNTFNQNSATINGLATGTTTDTFAIPNVIAGVPYMLGVGSDVVGPSLVLRCAPISTTGYPLESLDNHGNSTFFIDAAGTHNWGLSTTRNGTNHAPAGMDVNLYRLTAGILATDSALHALGGRILCQFTYGSGTRVLDLNALISWQAPAITNTGTGTGFYDQSIFIAPNGRVVHIGNNGWDFAASLNVRQFGTSDILICETTAATVPFKVDASSKVTIGTAGAPIKNVLTATATLDFPSTAAQSSADLTVAVTGAAVGDSVSLGLPASTAANTSFSARVSSAGVVSVRHNNYSSAAVDPASGTYRVTVHSF